MNKLIPSCSAVFFFAILLVAGCKKFDDLDSIQTPEQNAEYAVPLFTTQSSIKDLLEDFDENTFLTVQDDGLMLLNYKGDFIAQNSLDIFESLGNLDGVPLPVLDTLTALPFRFPNNVDLDYALLSNGLVRWTWTNPLSEPITVKVTFPSVKDDQGVPFSETTTDHLGPLFISPSINLAGYRFSAINDTLFVKYEAWKQDGTKLKVNNFFLVVEDFAASYVEGYLGQDIYELDRDTIEIDFFKNWTRGDVYFEDPKVFITVENSFGFPVRSKSQVFDVITVNGERLGLKSPFLDSGINIDFPSLNEVGEVKTTLFTFNKTNSNIDSILGSSPRYLDYDLDALPNPDGDTSVRGFLTDSSAFTVQLEVELPIYGRSLGFAARDTITTSFSSYDDVENVEFKLVTDNEMPLEVGVQVLFAKDGVVLDSLFAEGYSVVEAAPVDGDGNVNQVATKTTLIPFDKTRLDKVRSANQLFITADFSTFNSGQTSVRVLATQEVEIRMGMKVGL